MGIIKSILDTDLYKLTMQQAILRHYPNATVEYRFSNRGKQRFNDKFMAMLKNEIYELSLLSLTDDEHAFLADIPFITPQYLAYLKDYQFKPEQVWLGFTDDGDLDVRINGPWHETVFWEVPLLALISECYFLTVSTDWTDDLESAPYTLSGDVEDKALVKGTRLASAGCKFADFGTRRRRTRFAQERIVKALSQSDTFVGTSNVELAMKLGCKPIGTMAHEWVQAISALESLNHPNRFMLQRWQEVYKGRLGIALTDTYGMDSFLRDFTDEWARAFDGVRHDSGCPFDFTDKIIAHYKKLGIDPTTKTIVFSDSLNVDRAIAIQKYCEGKIRCSFGIGTHFTNDFEGSPALNIVIKLYSVNDFPVVKLSDSPTKAIGSKDAVKVAKWLFLDESLGD